MSTPLHSPCLHTRTAGYLWHGNSRRSHSSMPCWCSSQQSAAPAGSSTAGWLLAFGCWPQSLPLPQRHLFKKWLLVCAGNWQPAAAGSSRPQLIAAHRLRSHIFSVALQICCFTRNYCNEYANMLVRSCCWACSVFSLHFFRFSPKCKFMFFYNFYFYFFRIKMRSEIASCGPADARRWMVLQRRSRGMPFIQRCRCNCCCIHMQLCECPWVWCIRFYLFYLFILSTCKFVLSSGWSWSYLRDDSGVGFCVRSR